MRIMAFIGRDFLISQKPDYVPLWASRGWLLALAAYGDHPEEEEGTQL